MVKTVMKVCCLQVMIIVLTCYTLTANADVQLVEFQQDSNLNMTLVRIINQLDAILPLIDEGKREQRRFIVPVQFEFDTFIIDGAEHNGLRQDILKIRESLLDAIHHKPLTPHYIKPLQLDYVNIPSLPKAQDKKGV